MASNDGIPVLPGDLAVVPRDPGVRAGRDARVELAVNRKALAECRDQYVDLKTHYEAFVTPIKKKELKRG
jgi:hypothetical protein